MSTVLGDISISTEGKEDLVIRAANTCTVLKNTLFFALKNINVIIWYNFNRLQRQSNIFRHVARHHNSDLEA